MFLGVNCWKATQIKKIKKQTDFYHSKIHIKDIHSDQYLLNHLRKQNESSFKVVFTNILKCIVDIFPRSSFMFFL